MIPVSLTLAEIQHAGQIGVARHAEALLEGRQDQHGAKKARDVWGLHIEGACGELAFSKATGRYWSGPVGNFKEADVGDRVQVRTRTHHNQDLIVREGDRADHAFALVTGRAPDFVVHGWIWGRDAKQARWLRDYGGHGPAFFVPKEALRPIDTRAHARAA